MNEDANAANANDNNGGEEWSTAQRSLTLDEITMLEQAGCTAEDWNGITVAEDFVPEHIRNTRFYGQVHLGVFDKQIEVESGFTRHTGIFNATLRDVTVGDNCLIENIGSYISGYDIGEECYISNVGRMAADAGATFGEGAAIAVLNEAGDGNVMIYSGLTSQAAAFMVAGAGDKELWQRLRDMVRRHTEDIHLKRAAVGYRVKIAGTREIINTMIGDECEISYAARLHDCTLSGGSEASVYIGNDVICENTVVAAGASVVGGAHTDNCFVGEACHIGKGFSAESSVFFANSYMDNGEACAAFCGPFTVSHHKSTLLIGGMYSFYNAGSATNYSNHAYKIGPIHYGTLARGAKTASGAHILMPANIGAFSMCMGKIQNHPDTSDLPFSYVIASGEKTYLVPGCNLATVGTYRDTQKWHKRDMRTRNNRQSIVNFDWLSPYTIQKAVAARNILKKIIAGQGDDAEEYSYGCCMIKNGALKKGIRLYDMMIRMYFGEIAGKHPDAPLPGSTEGTGSWTDLAGMLVPESETMRLADEIKSGTVASITEMERRMNEMNDRYGEYAWNWAYGAMTDYYKLESLTADDMQRIIEDGRSATAAWLAAIVRDAEKEAALGDVDDAVVNEFIKSIESRLMQ